MEKLYKVLEMELKTYTPVDLKFVFEKIKTLSFDYIKVLHYIFAFDFICRRPGLSKDQISISKSIFINYIILKCRHTF